MIRILVPLDGSALAEQALAHAIAMARSFKSKVFLIRVVNDAPAAGDVVARSADVRLQAAEARSYLEDIRAKHAEPGITISTSVIFGRPAEEILDYAKDNDIGLIALTSYGKSGITEFVQGSTVYKVVSRSRMSILLVRPNLHLQTDLRYRKLLVPLDGSYRTDWALFLATSIARAHRAELMLMLVLQTPSAPRRMPASRTERELVERLLEIHKSDATHHLHELEAQLPDDIAYSSRVVVAEEAAQVIAELAESEDVGLLVLSAHGLSAGDCWLHGPVSETLLSHSTRPLLVLQDRLSSDKVAFEPRAESLAGGG